MGQMITLQNLIETLPQQGSVEWLGIRSARKLPLTPVEQVKATTDRGLEGDHYSKNSGKRQVTLIQAEHLYAVASMLGIDTIQPETVRRNIVVRGINLLALKDKHFKLGDVTLAFTGLCHPCSRMETLLGPGGYNAMRGHGGITARVLDGGFVRVGDVVGVSKSM
jgi:MOSC domain-containing protein YiiM